jgi:uncharacterized membrane protein YbhN (UPF0104 family)
MLRRSEANGRQSFNEGRDLYFTDLFACLAGVARANSVHCLTSYVVRLAFRIDDRKRRISAGADGQTLVPQHGERVRECFRVSISPLDWLHNVLLTLFSLPAMLSVRYRQSSLIVYPPGEVC